MAENKKSFIAYADWIDVFDQLEDDEAGRLVKHLFRYVNDLSPDPEDRLTKMCFISIKAALKRDLAKYEKIRKKRSDAGKASANKRQQMSTSVNTAEQTSTNPTVSVNDNVSVNVNVNDKLNPEDYKIFRDVVSFFDKKYYKESKWLECYDKMIRIDGYSEKEIFEIVKYFTNDEFWKGNFISLLKLRKTNSEGIKYIDVFSTKLKTNAAYKGSNIKNENNGHNFKIVN